MKASSLKAIEAAAPEIVGLALSGAGDSRKYENLPFQWAIALTSRLASYPEWPHLASDLIESESRYRKLDPIDSRSAREILRALIAGGAPIRSDRSRGYQWIKK